MSSWWEQTDNYPDRKLLAALLPSYQEQIIETLQNLCYNPLKEMFGIFPNMIFFDEKCVFSAVDFGARYKDRQAPHWFAKRWWSAILGIIPCDVIPTDVMFSNILVNLASCEVVTSFCSIYFFVYRLFWCNPQLSQFGQLLPAISPLVIHVAAVRPGTMWLSVPKHLLALDGWAVTKK